MQTKFTIEQDGITIDEFDTADEARESIEDLSPEMGAFGTYEISKWERKSYFGKWREQWSEEIREITSIASP